MCISLQCQIITLQHYLLPLAQGLAGFIVNAYCINKVFAYWLFAGLHTKLAKVAVTKDSRCSPLRVFFSHDPGEGTGDVWNATEDQRISGTHAVPSPAHDWDLQAAAAATAPALAPEAVSMTVLAETCVVRMVGMGERGERHRSLLHSCFVGTWCSTEGKALLEYCIGNILSDSIASCLPCGRNQCQEFGQSQISVQNWGTLSLKYRFLCNGTKQFCFPKHVSRLVTTSLTSLSSLTIHHLASEGERGQAQCLISGFQLEPKVQQDSTTEQPADRNVLRVCTHAEESEWVCSSLLCSMGMAANMELSPYLLQGIHLSILATACGARTVRTSLAKYLDPTTVHLWGCWRAGVLKSSFLFGDGIQII